MSFSRINYNGLFTHVENQVRAVLGYTTGLTPGETTRNKKLTEFYVNICRPFIFGSPLGKSHIKKIHDKWHGQESYRVLMYFIMQQIAVYIADNNGDWDQAVREAVEKIIVPKIDSTNTADVEDVVTLFLNNGWLFAAWVMQNTGFRVMSTALELIHSVQSTRK